MIIGIDDSGNFQSDKLSMFAAIFIRPKKAKNIKKAFEKWERTLPKECSVNGEVKGWLLTDNQLQYFVEHIMSDNGYCQIKHQVFAIAPDNDTNNKLEKQRAKNVTQYRDGAVESRKKGKKYFTVAGEYEQTADWLASKSMKTLLKIELLGMTIFKSFNLAIITSVLRGYDKELGKLTIKIDEGLVDRPSSKAYWRDIMRSTFWQLSRHNGGVIHISEWRANHPFLKRFYKHPQSTESLAMFTGEIRECMDFYDSRDHFEIRIADIVASTYFRHFVSEENLSSTMRTLQTTRVEFGKSYTLLKMSDNDDPNPLNPYTDKVDGVTMAEIESRYSSID
jgi:hypothetical protein